VKAAALKFMAAVRFCERAWLLASMTMYLAWAFSISLVILAIAGASGVVRLASERLSPVS